VRGTRLQYRALHHGHAMTDTHKWQLLALAALLSALVYLLAPVLTPFAVAALLAYLGDPLVDRLERRRLSRTLAVTVVFGLMTLALVIALLLLIPMLERQILRFIEQLPRYVAWLQDNLLPWLEQQFGVDIERFEPANLVAMLRQHWAQAGGIAAAVLGGVSKSGMAIMLWITNLLLIPVVTFYLLRDWDVMVERIRILLPRAVEPTISRLARQSDEVLGGFLRGQLSVMLALGAIYTIGLSLVGIDLALLIGMLAGLVSFIPYLGAIVGIGAGIIAALVQHGDLWHVALVVGVFAIGQTIESFALTPWLVGDRIGLHPVAVIFAILAGGQLFGFLGVLLALPVAAVVMVLLRYAHERYTASTLYGAGDGAPGTPAAPPTPGGVVQARDLASIAMLASAAVVAGPISNAGPSDGIESAAHEVHGPDAAQPLPSPEPRPPQ
jgi:predicted PurR-regulated permease PerM